MQYCWGYYYDNIIEYIFMYIPQKPFYSEFMYNLIPIISHNDKPL